MVPGAGDRGTNILRHHTPNINAQNIIPTHTISPNPLTAKERFRSISPIGEPSNYMGEFEEQAINNSSCSDPLDNIIYAGCL